MLDKTAQAEAWDEVLLLASQGHELLMQALEQLTRSPTSTIYAADGEALQRVARAALCFDQIMDKAQPF